MQTNPLATISFVKILGCLPEFQSQMQTNPLATVVDGVCESIWSEFQSQMQTNPLATLLERCFEALHASISIADAKPIPWRRQFRFADCHCLQCFNRRCEANPLATWEA